MTPPGTTRVRWYARREETRWQRISEAAAAWFLNAMNDPAHEQYAELEGWRVARIEVTAS